MDIYNYFTTSLLCNIFHRASYVIRIITIFVTVTAIIGLL